MCTLRDEHGGRTVDPMGLSERYRRRVRISASMVVAAGNGGLAWLGTAGRLDFTVPTSIDFLGRVVSNDMWIWILAGTALAVVLSVLYDRWHVPALAAATGVIGAWSFLNLLWGLNPVRPVSLAGPLLGGVVTALAYLLTTWWARSDEHAKGR